MKKTFGPFSFDTPTRELRRNGDIVKLQSQPAQVLAVLVEHAGEVVTRDALRQAVWRGDTFVDFDKGLNFAIAQVRTALGDSADSPTYIPDEKKAALAGLYVFGRGEADRIEIKLDRGSLMFLRTGMQFGRGLVHVGDRAFHPVGASAVRIRFAIANGVTTLTVHDPNLVLTATKRG